MTPQLRNPEGGVDPRLVEGTPGNLNLYDEVRRRIHGYIYIFLVPNERLVLDVVALVRLGSALEGSRFMVNDPNGVIFIPRSAAKASTRRPMTPFSFSCAPDGHMISSNPSS